MLYNLRYIYFLILVLCPVLVLAQEPNDCINSTAICGNINFTFTPTGPGNDDFSLNPNPNCLPNDPVESQSVWLKLVIDTPGDLEFVLRPNNGTDDYDWAVYGPDVPCNTLGNAIRCSSTMFLGNGSTGLGNGAVDTTEGPGTGDAFLAPLSVNNGETYYLFINNWSSSSSGFQLDFGGTATFNPSPTIETPIGTLIDLEECDIDGVIDNQAAFDLTVNSGIILGTQTGLTIQFFTTNGNAQIGNNPILDPTNFRNITSPQIIYVRVTNTLTGCFETTQFSIEVLNSLNIGVPNDLFLCDADNDGFSQFDLSQNDTVIRNGEANTIVSYHNSQVDALSGNNDLTLLYTNSTAFTQEIIWARLESTVTGCFRVESFTIDVFRTPLVNPVPNQMVCDDDNDGFWSFDFTPLDAIALGAQFPTDFTVSYYATQADADNRINAIINPYPNQLAYQQEDIFIRVENNLNINCFDTGSFLIHVFETPSAIIADYELCDNLNDSDDTNGIVFFDLQTRVNEVLGTRLIADFEVTFYYTQAEADAAVLGTEITTPIQNTTNPQSIVTRIENRSNTSCYGTAQFNLVVNPLPVVTPTVVLTQCDNDTDGISDFNLTEANILISNDAANETFTYYLSQAEADAGLVANQIVNFINYPNPTPLNSSVFARVETINGCYRTVRIDLFVGATQIPVGFNLNYEVCDDKLFDGDNTNGIAAFDFSDATAQVKGLFPLGQNITVTYYTNEADALAETNVIMDISNHRNTSSANMQQIYVRVDSDVVNACLGLGNHITLIVNQLPIANTINDYALCSDTDFTVFDLTTRDAEVTAAQTTPILVSYHLSEQDAINNTPVVNAVNYTNTSNPQTIYIRAQFDDNGSGVGDIDECFSTDMSFSLIVNYNPSIFLPDPIRICNNQIPTLYDLTIRENQITGGDASIILSYFESQLDLDNNNPIVNPDMYTNTLLDRDILVLATGTNLCTSTTILSLKTILYANLNTTPTAIEECEIDNDGFDFFDLERRELEILNGLNPADFKFTYYENEADAIDGNSNVISNIGNYENIQAVTQIIYVRVQPIANECFIVVPITLIVNPVPEIDIEEKYVICLDGNSTVVNSVTQTFLPAPPIDTQLNNSEYTFQWYKGTEGEVNTDPASVIIVGATSSTYSPQAKGNYTVIATNIATGCRIPASTVVLSSYPPESIAVELVSEAFSDNNIIEVTVVGNGEYEYRLDFGPWRISNIFEQVTGGAHVVYVRDAANCNIISEIQIVIDYPKYFTPNGDGYHDTWNISGIATQPNSIIYIFDRYGKLLKQINPTGVGWDGTFNGGKLPSSDYWFVIKYSEPSDGTQKEFKAHFSLKR